VDYEINRIGWCVHVPKVNQKNFKEGCECVSIRKTPKRRLWSRWNSRWGRMSYRGKEDYGKKLRRRKKWSCEKT
jgi:hypothetical protein